MEPTGEQTPTREEFPLNPNVSTRQQRDSSASAQALHEEAQPFDQREGTTSDTDGPSGTGSEHPSPDQSSTTDQAPVTPFLSKIPEAPETIESDPYLDARGFTVLDSPTKSHNELIRDAKRQSIGRRHKRHSKRDRFSLNEYETDSESSEEEQDTPLMFRGDQLILDGRKLDLGVKAKDERTFTPARLWDKETRLTLSREDQVIFKNAATEYILKGNKLNLPQVTATNTKYLSSVRNLRNQIKTIVEHLTLYDMIDVFTILVPKDVSSRPDLESITFNLFEDYPRLHADIVANSCTWLNVWVTSPYIPQHMAYTFTFLKNNTHETLWNSCADEYDAFKPLQKGGPLMAYLLLRRIQDSSEQAMDHLLKQVIRLKINKLPGEDVEQAVSLIKSTHTVLKNSSTSHHSYLPRDFPQSVLKVYQTSSVTEFNRPFATQEESILMKSDMRGTHPAWPSVSELNSLALNMYRRLKASGAWDSKVKGQSGAFTTQFIREVLKCFNCGSTDHLLNACPKPRNEERIAANRAKYMDSKGRKDKRPKHKTGSDGKPMILNKKGVYVLDQKKIRASLNGTTSAPTNVTPTPSSQSHASESSRTPTENTRTGAAPTSPPVGITESTTSSSRPRVSFGSAHRQSLIRNHVPS